jgi:hypothetical protein
VGLGSIYDALASARVSFSAMSWNGFNVYGDEASIKEVGRLQHQDYVVECLRKEVLALRKMKCHATRPKTAVTGG